MNRTTIFATAFVSLTTALSGCAFTLNKDDLIKADAVEIETIPAANATYLYTNVFQDGVKLYITGRVALESPKVAREDPGHMDISARSTDGKVLMISHTPYIQHHHSGKRNQVDFNTAARLQVPQGSIVTFEHHWAKLGVHDSGNQASSE